MAESNPHDPTVRLPNGGKSAAEDALFGKTLVREGVLSADQLQEALQTQKKLRSQGLALRLGEVLVRDGALNPGQVRQYLSLVGKQLLRCGKCGKNYNVKNWTREREVFCPTCSGVLVPPASDQTIDAHGSHVLPSIGSAGEDRGPVGTPFGPYRLLEELGRGGMGVVWKAWDTRLKRVVALKQILPGEKADDVNVQRFVREAQLAAKLRHPNIVGVHDVGEQDGARYFTTDYIVAQPLDKLIKKGVAVRQALEWIKAAAEALAYAHEQGVVHRDIKPANFLVDGKNQIFIMDFGLAAEVDLRKEAGARRARLTISGQVLGTPQYMSPEQADGETSSLGPATDQFSLGVVLYELLTGRTPFRAKTVWDLLRAIGQDDPFPPTQLNRRIHRDVETICLKALEKNPEKRYASIGDLAADLGRYLGGEPIAARPMTSAERLMRKAVRHRAIVIPTAAAAILAIAFGGWALSASFQKTKNIETTLAKAQAAEGVAKDAPADEDLERTLIAARDAFNATLALDGENREAKAGLARLQKRLDDLKTARELALTDAQKQAAREAENRKGQEDAGEFLELGRKGLDEAVRYLYDKNANYEELVKKVEVGQKVIEQALEKAPNLALAHHLLGRCWNLRGWDDKAEASWRRAIELRPDFGPPHYELGRLLMMQSYPLTLAPNDTPEVRETNRPKAQRLVDDARKELETARRGVGFDDPLQRAVGEAMKAIAASDLESVRTQARDGIKNFEGQSGVEDFHWLAGLAAPDGSAEKVAYYDHAIELRPTHALAHFCRGSFRQAKADLEGAIQDFTSALQISPRFAHAFINRGVARHAKGELDAAIRDYTAALEIDPWMAEAFANRGMARQKSGDIDEAIEDFTEALKLNSRLAMAFHGRGLAHAHAGDLDAAIHDCTEALKINPRLAGAFVSRGAARQAKGDYDGAIADSTEALGINPQVAEPFINRGAARGAKGDFEGAIKDFTEALKIDPHDARAFTNRGLVRRDTGDFDGSIQDCTEALRIDPRHTAAYVNRGRARLDTGDLDGAIQDFTGALKIDSRQATAFHNRSVARLEKGDPDGAIQDATDALKINPRYAEAFGNRGNARQAKGEFDMAIQDYTEALELNPLLAKVLVNRGLVLYAKGDLAGTIRDSTAALKIDPHLAEAFLLRGNARLDRGELDGMIDDYAKALEVARPNWPQRKSVEEALQAARAAKGSAK